jgi:hypothetical protein
LFSGFSFTAISADCNASLELSLFASGPWSKSNLASK